MDQVMLKNSFYEKTARARIQAVVDEHSFNEILKPAEIEVSPHLSALDIPGSFDDGVIIGTARLNGTPVHIMAQEGQFMGGAVGEIHGAKIVGLLHKAIQDQTQAVVFFVDSGGVRLHEANAGLIAISEIMRAMLQVRNAGIPSSTIIMTEEGRLALSGPEVIETVKGVEEFDSKDRALVWRVTGGKHRYLLNHVQALVEDDIADIRDAILTQLDAKVAPLDLEQLLKQQQQLEHQYQRWFGKNDGLQIWHEMGISQPEKIPMLSAHEVVLLKQG